MISKKITYQGNFGPEAIALIYDITRKNEITGFVKVVSDKQVELDLEGDASVIKLIQHQIDRKVKTAITGKTVDPMPYQNYKGIILIK
jgi:hypothetical protein